MTYPPAPIYSSLQPSIIKCYISISVISSHKKNTKYSVPVLSLITILKKVINSFKLGFGTLERFILSKRL